jgi:hypothetical protein
MESRKSYPDFDSYIKISALYSVLFGQMNITKQRAFPTIPNKNICVPIGPDFDS